MILSPTHRYTLGRILPMLVALMDALSGGDKQDMREAIEIIRKLAR